MPCTMYDLRCVMAEARKPSAIIHQTSAIEGGFPLVARRLEFRLEVLVERGLGADFGEEGVLAGDEELFHRRRCGDNLLGVDRVEETLLHREENRDLELDRVRVELRLLEQFDDARATFELRLGLRIEV